MQWIHSLDCMVKDNLGPSAPEWTQVGPRSRVRPSGLKWASLDSCNGCTHLIAWLRKTWARVSPRGPKWVLGASEPELAQVSPSEPHWIHLMDAYNGFIQWRGFIGFMHWIHSLHSFNGFIRRSDSLDSFIGFIQWSDSLDSFIGFIQWIHSVESFIGFIHWIHSKDSFNGFTQWIHSKE